MKKTIGLVLVLAALILGGYYGMGLVTERTLKRNIEVVNQSGNVAVDLKNYQRHWFGSKAAVDVRVHVAERITSDDNGKSMTVPAENYTLDMPVTIYHGPIIYTGKGVLLGLGYAQSHLTLPKELAEKFTTYFTPESTQPELDFSVYVSYFNNSRFNMDVPAFKLVSKEGKGQADWLGMTSNVSLSSDLNNINGSLTLNGVKVVHEKMNALMGPATGSYDLHRATEGLYLGEVSLDVPSIIVTQDNVTYFQLDKFKERNESNIRDGLFYITTDVSIDKVLFNGITYGPGEISISLRNLDAPVMVSLNEKVTKMNHAVGAERQQAMFAMLPELPKLFSQGAKLEVTALKLTLPEGNINGELSIELPKGESSNPFQLLQKIEGKGKFQVPAILLKTALTESIMQKESAKSSPQAALNNAQPTEALKTTDLQAVPADKSIANAKQQATAEADKKLSALVQAKMLVESGSDYILEFNLSKGQLTVNGSPFDPSTFKF